MSKVTGPNGPLTTTASRAKANAGTLAKRTRPARPSATSTVVVTRPQGHWMRTSVSGSRASTSPRSTAKRPSAITAWPHMVE